MTYEFQCRSCNGQFEVYATLEEKNRGLAPTCPEFGELFRTECCCWGTHKMYF